jgi:ribonuclease HI
MEMTLKNYEVWTDGASSNNGKPNCLGGWGFIILEDGAECARGSGAEFPSSNQRMELIAAIMGLTELMKRADGFTPITLYSDSAYLINCYKQNWWRNWLNNGWVNSKREPVANRDLWEKLIPFFQMANIRWEKVKGHCGVHWNEEVDKLAVCAKIGGRPLMEEMSQ